VIYLLLLSLERHVFFTDHSKSERILSTIYGIMESMVQAFAISYSIIC